MAFCNCGCGGQTPLYKKTSRADGAVKGQPAKWLKGHYIRSHRPPQPPRKPIPTRQACTKCGTVYPVTKKYFYPQSPARGGFNKWCKACTYQQGKKWTAAHAKDAEVYQQTYRAAHAAASKAYSAWYRSQHREEISAQCRAWRKLHPGQLPAQREYQKKYPERIKEWNRRGRNNRRAKEKQVPTERIDYQAVYDRCSGLCGICDEPVIFQQAHWDHIIPISRGGGNISANLQPAHAFCNQTKGSRSLEWARARIRELQRGS